MKIDEFNVREVAGVAAVLNETAGRTSRVRLTELAERIELVVAPYNYTPQLTPDEARKLARQLYRLARRIEARQSA